MSDTEQPPSQTTARPGKARYIMIGGFLGAGKTTSVSRLAKRLSGKGLRVGLITNDQGSELVDTAMLRSRGFATEEISGGCFCCRFNSLVEAADRLTSATAPEVFIAEPVGSCTDLVATVTYPLRRMYGDQFSVAPLSVVIDPVRALRVLGLETGGRFSERVIYIYRKQLEEAEMIVVNKCDLLDQDRMARLTQALRGEFPNAEILQASARTGIGLEDWFTKLEVNDALGGSDAMEVDYEVYADGEARLGWLNATLRASASRAFDGNALLQRLATGMQQLLADAQAEVAHLKMTLSSPDAIAGLAAINLVRNDLVPELSEQLEDPVTGGEVIVNLRAEAAPEALKEALEGAVAACGSDGSGILLVLEHLEHFRPGKPQPTHRLKTLA